MPSGELAADGRHVDREVAEVFLADCELLQHQVPADEREARVRDRDLRDQRVRDPRGHAVPGAPAPRHADDHQCGEPQGDDPERDLEQPLDRHAVD